MLIVERRIEAAETACLGGIDELDLTLYQVEEAVEHIEFIYSTVHSAS